MTQPVATSAEIAAAIRTISDFPKPGISFKDITPVLADGRLFAATIDHLIAGFEPGSVDTVVGIDARGFIFAAGAALRLGCGFVPVRKKGKLPYETFEESYDLEYASNTIAIPTASAMMTRHTRIRRPPFTNPTIAPKTTAGAKRRLPLRKGINQSKNALDHASLIQRNSPRSTLDSQVMERGALTGEVRAQSRFPWP